MAGDGITISQAVSIVNNTLPKLVKQKFVDTVKLTEYAFLDEFVYRGKAAVSANGTEFQKRARLRPNTGSTSPTRMYQSRTAQKGPGNEIWKIPLILADNLGIVFDRREQAFNSGDDVQIVDFMKSERSAAWEDVANWLEAQLVGVPQTSTDDQNWRGMKYYARRSMNSSGVYVADSTGGFNGTYGLYGDGTVYSTINNIDASLVKNERARCWVGTRPAVMTLDVCRMIRRAAEANNFRPLQMLKGEQKTGDCVIFMRPTDHEAYKDIVSTGPDDRDGDIFPFTDYEISGMRIKRAPQLEGDALLPIYGARLNFFDLLQLPGFWLKEQPAFKQDHNVGYVPIDLIGNLFSDNPRGGLFHIHYSF